MRPSGRSCAQAPLTSPSVQCCRLLARPALALRCLDACGAHEWGTTAYLLERARLHIQICNTHKACSILSRLLGQLQRQDFCKEHGEALVSRCAGFERPAGWLAAPAGSMWGSALCVWHVAAGSSCGMCSRGAVVLHASAGRPMQAVTFMGGALHVGSLSCSSTMAD